MSRPINPYAYDPTDDTCSECGAHMNDAHDSRCPYASDADEDTEVFERAGGTSGYVDPAGPVDKD